MSATTARADAETILRFPAERQDLRWRGFLGAERIERRTTSAPSRPATS